jgi:6-pyruvoyl-tetrahydropterin synthase
MKSSVSTITIFEMEHKLNNDTHMHPHSYQLQATFQGVIDTGTGNIINKDVRDSLINQIFDKYNGAELHADNFYGLNPTVENLANEIFKFIRERSNQIHTIKLWESQEVFAEVGY